MRIEVIERRVYEVPEILESDMREAVQRLATGESLETVDLDLEIEEMISSIEYRCGGPEEVQTVTIKEING